ncbi:cytochrome bd oxidase small subunit CydS [Lentibacillus saliphilus]
MENFLLFIAPFIVLIISIVIAFWVSLQDDAVTKDESQ